MDVGVALALDVTRKCFDACVARPNARLDDAERACLSTCAATLLAARRLMAAELTQMVSERSANAASSTDAETTNN